MIKASKLCQNSCGLEDDTVKFDSEPPKLKHLIEVNKIKFNVKEIVDEACENQTAT